MTRQVLFSCRNHHYLDEQHTLSSETDWGRIAFQTKMKTIEMNFSSLHCAKVNVYNSVREREREKGREEKREESERYDKVFPLCLCYFAFNRIIFGQVSRCDGNVVPEGF